MKTHQISESIQGESVSKFINISVVLFDVFFIGEPNDVAFQFLLRW